MQEKKERSFGAYLLLTAKGFCMGAADVVPGVSGGTMAFILGIYEELIGAIKSFDLKSLKLTAAGKVRQLLDRVAWRFLLAVGCGILLAIFSLSKVLAWLLQNEPVLIWSFFLGLILASVVTVSKRVETWRPLTWCCLFFGLAGIYVLVGIVPGTTPDSYGFLFVSGAVAICAMILPGISGSFILVLMGKYQYILEAVNESEFAGA
jgi:putative membrane protein